MKIVIKTYKYKLKTNSNQAEKLNAWINTCRAVYNLALETKIEAYKTRFTVANGNVKPLSLTKYDLIKQLPELKKEFDWIKDVPAQSLQAVIERMDKAYKTFFSGGGFPKFAKKGFYKSMLFKQGIKCNSKHISLPKIGKLKYFNSKNIPNEAKIKNAIVSKEVDGFYISLVVEQFSEKKYLNPKSDNQAVGLDMGVKLFYALSDGTTKNNPQILKTYERELRIAQRSLSRKVKKSNNWYKQVKKISKIHLKIKRTRYDFSQKASTELITGFQKIVTEDLRLKNMTKSAKGNQEEHGKKVKQKSGLNRVILDVAIGEFFRQLEYKADWYGREFLQIDPKYTSQICSQCGYKSKENRKTQAIFECVNCGQKENADVNAAKNILARAEPMYANVVH